MADGASLFWTVLLPERHQKVYHMQIGRSSDLLLSLNAFPSDLFCRDSGKGFVQYIV
jgi:hypothetical protein